MSQSSSKSSWWAYLWLKSETPLIIFILINIVISSVTGYLTPRFITAFYESLNNDAAFYHQLTLLGVLYGAEYINRFLFSLATHRYIQLLLLDVRKQSYAL